MKRIIRVFPRRTNATPTDSLAVVGRGPELFDEADEVHVSVTFAWDVPLAWRLAKEWETVAPVKIDGPGLWSEGGEFVPGMYLKPGYVITSRGCPNSCWFCRAWRNEGNTIRELEIKEGWNVLDNNLLACSRNHQEAVFEMLMRQPARPRFTGGFEATLFTDWHANWMVRLNPDVIWFAYDLPQDYPMLCRATYYCLKAGLITGKHRVCCYVLCGWNREGKTDTFEAAEMRMIQVVKMGCFPQAMLLDRGEDWPDPERKQWRRFAREWSNKVIVGAKCKAIVALHLNARNAVAGETPPIRHGGGKE